jgi:hypothetical protein
MKSKSDFWLHLHHLASDLENEGTTVDEQAEHLAQMYESLSRPLQDVYGENLETVIRALTTVALRCKVSRRKLS